MFENRFARITLFVLVCALALFAPALALAQEAAAETTAEPSWLPLVLTLLSAIVGSGLLSTVVSSDRWWMKILDAIALNWGKARNDPRCQ